MIRPEATDPLSKLLRALRVIPHVLFALLLLVAAINSGEWVSAVILGGVYFSGTVGRSEYSPWWLAGVCLVWAGMSWSHYPYVWLLFPLVIIVMKTLPRFVGLFVSAGLCALSVLVSPEMTTGGTVGPIIGTMVAVGAWLVYDLLRAEAISHRDTAAQLRETADALAESEHAAGRLEERDRLSREIHDTLAQGFSSIALLSRAARTSVTDGESSTALAQLGMIDDVARDNLAEARRFVADLAAPDTAQDVPSTLRGLVAATKDRYNAMSSEADDKLAIELHLDGDTAREIPDNIARVIIRAAQESLNNVVRHAQATAAHVTYSVFDDAVSLDVTDNGVGFRGDYGYGLRGLERRVHEVGGTLDITANPTTLNVLIPLGGQRD